MTWQKKNGPLPPGSPKGKKKKEGPKVRKQETYCKKKKYKYWGKKPIFVKDMKKDSIILRENREGGEC